MIPPGTRVRVSTKNNGTMMGWVQWTEEPLATHGYRIKTTTGQFMEVPFDKLEPEYPAELDEDVIENLQANRGMEASCILASLKDMSLFRCWRCGRHDCDVQYSALKGDLLTYECESCLPLAAAEANIKDAKAFLEDRYLPDFQACLNATGIVNKKGIVGEHDFEWHQTQGHWIES